MKIDFYKNILKIMILFSLIGCNFSYKEKYVYTIHKNKAKEKKSFAYFYQALHYKQKKKYLKSLEILEKVCRLTPNEAIVYLHFADCYYQLNKLLTAREYLNLAEKYSKKKDYLICFDIGKMYELLGDFKEAIRFYKKAIKINPKFNKALISIYNITENNNKLYRRRGNE